MAESEKFFLVDAFFFQVVFLLSAFCFVNFVIFNIFSDSSVECLFRRRVGVEGKEVERHFACLNGLWKRYSDSDPSDLCKYLKALVGWLTFSCVSSS